MKKAMVLTMLVILAAISFGCSRAYNLTENRVIPHSDMRLRSETTMLMRNDMLLSEQSAMISYDDAGGMYGGGGMYIEEEIPASANLNNVERKLTRSATVRIRVENLDAADASVSALLNKYNAYAASTYASEDNRFYSLRVPSNRYDDFLAETGGMGRVLHRSEDTEDVTLRYYDLEGRLEMKRVLLRTFQTYLTQARNIEEILSVEMRIAELQRDIEWTGTQLRDLTNRVDYAIINLQLSGPVTVSRPQGDTLGERIKQLFGNFGGFLSTVAVVLIGIVIYGIPLLAIIAALFLVLFGKIGLMRKLWGMLKK